MERFNKNAVDGLELAELLLERNPRSSLLHRSHLPVEEPRCLKLTLTSEFIRAKSCKQKANSFYRFKIHLNIKAAELHELSSMDGFKSGKAGNVFSEL